MIPLFLLVEDSEDDAYLMSVAFEEAKVACHWQRVKDGQTALDYLGGAGIYGDRIRFPLPQVIYLDLKLPQVSGLQVLQWVRSQSALKSIVVIVLTSSTAPIDFNRAIQFGANSVMTKPAQPTQVLELMKTFRVLGEQTPPGVEKSA